MSRDLQFEYSERYHSHLQAIATQLEIYISGVLGGTPHIDRIGARAKSPDRFIAKAKKTDRDGNIRYTDPIREIQDQIGARIIVFYLDDVEAVKKILKEYLRPIEEIYKEPYNPDSFGYTGEHLIALMPEEAKVEGSEDHCPTVFELQIKTLYQHAWSEAGHDIAYKANRELTRDEKRQLAFTAAQSWGADRIFHELSNSMSRPAGNDL